MIDLYTWPTPNGQKVQIMLEEVGLPYRVVPVDITRRDQWLRGLRKRGDPALSGGEDRTTDAVRSISPERGDAVVDVADVGPGSDVRTGAALPPLCTRDHLLRHRSLHARRAATPQGPGSSAEESPLSVRRIFDRGHRLLSVDPYPQDGEPEPGQFSERRALVRHRPGAPGRRAWPEGPRRELGRCNEEQRGEVPPVWCAAVPGVTEICEPRSAE